MICSHLKFTQMEKVEYKKKLTPWQRCLKAINLIWVYVRRATADYQGRGKSTGGV